MTSFCPSAIHAGKTLKMCNKKLIPVKRFVLWQSFSMTLRGEAIYYLYVKGHQSAIIGLGGHTLAFVFKNDEMIPTANVPGTVLCT